MAGFLLDTVARVTGATVKQLIHWDRTNLIRPSIARARGKGTRRVYSFLDILAIKTAVMLRREGISLQKIRQCLRYLREVYPQCEQPLANLNLLTDGHSVFLLTSDPTSACRDRKVVDTLAGGQMLFLVPIGRLACEVQREVARLHPEEVSNLFYAGDTGKQSADPAQRVRTSREGLREGSAAVGRAAS
ncbi:MAG: MerR family transcriptional regulator [Gemmatales bacterium]|nr:MerR family transcriptional regulator [Gemmatales bacterium]MDW7993973.1 MerR family transcriptional regulator [Gemmatales bacterium]